MTGSRDRIGIPVSRRHIITVLDFMRVHADGR